MNPHLILYLVVSFSLVHPLWAQDDSTKARLVNDLFEVTGKFSDNVSEMLDERIIQTLANDARLLRHHKREGFLALKQAIDGADLKRQYKAIWQTASIEDLELFLKIWNVGVSKKVWEAYNATEKIIQAKVDDDIKRAVDEVKKSPGPSAGPNQLTRMIWKWFPETKACTLK